MVNNCATMNDCCCYPWQQQTQQYQSKVLIPCSLLQQSTLTQQITKQCMQDVQWHPSWCTQPIHRNQNKDATCQWHWHPEPTCLAGIHDINALCKSICIWSMAQHSTSYTQTAINTTSKDLINTPTDMTMTMATTPMTKTKNNGNSPMTIMTLQTTTQ